MKHSEPPYGFLRNKNVYIRTWMGPIDLIPGRNKEGKGNPSQSKTGIRWKGSREKRLSSYLPSKKRHKGKEARKLEKALAL